MTLSFRPHHFLCTLGFQGKGYSPPFVENYRNIVSALEENPDLSVRIVYYGDSICSACPQEINDVCTQEDKVSLLDQRHADILFLTVGEVLTWRHVKTRIKNNMTLEAFHKACEGCSWKSLGTCEAALRALRGTDEETAPS